MSLYQTDRLMDTLIKQEQNRQSDHIELIASENFTSQAVREAQGSILTNKYAEGYPHKRYYGGCEVVDKIEELAIERAKKLFSAKYANVQAHSGSQANMAAYRALINHGDKVLGMSLNQGGHLTHGMPLNFSGQDYVFESYGVDPLSELIDYEAVRRIALAFQPKLIVAGASAYSRIIDFTRFRAIADEVGAMLMVDMAHIAGLVAAGLHPNPVDVADVVTSTTHKTLRGPRGGLILTNSEEVIKKINKTIFPGMQGGPLMHVIAAKAVAFGEALEEGFVAYQKQVIANARALAAALQKRGYKIISGGTDNHLFSVDVKKSVGLTGKFAEELLDRVHITCNKNTIPNETEKPFVTSGLRIGTPAVTTRGMKEKEMEAIALLIDRTLRHAHDEEELQKIKNEVIAFVHPFLMIE